MDLWSVNKSEQGLLKAHEYVFEFEAYFIHNWMRETKNSVCAG